MVRHLLETTSQRAANYLEQLDQRLVRPEAESVAGLAAFDEPLPSDPTAPEAVLAMMDDIGSPATMAMAGPRFFGFVIGGSLPVTLAANWLAGAWDQNSRFTTSRLPQPGWSRSHCAGCWSFSASRECGGAFVTGATVANLTALAAARQRCSIEPVGTSKRMACLARLPSPSSSAKRLIPQSSNRLACWAWGETGWCVCRSMDRAGCEPKRYLSSPDLRLSACKPATSTPVRSIRLAQSASKHMRMEPGCMWTAPLASGPPGALTCAFG